MNEFLQITGDPSAAIKWLTIFCGFAALYMQMRQWERRISGKLEKIEIAQPLTVTEAHPPVSRSEIEPLIARISRLEREVSIMATRMTREKDEILTKLADLSQHTTDGFRALERAIGRLEGGRLS